MEERRRKQSIENKKKEGESINIEQQKVDRIGRNNDNKVPNRIDAHRGALRGRPTSVMHPTCTTTLKRPSTHGIHTPK